MPARPTTAWRGVNDGMRLKNAHFGIGRSCLDLDLGLLRLELDLLRLDLDLLRLHLDLLRLHLDLLRLHLDLLRLPLYKNHTNFLRHLYSIRL
jgi:hypothetical protein